MYGAWVDRYVDTAEELGQARLAPGLFKPEHVEALEKKAARERGFAMFWRAQS
jgi:hypothetical protein